MFLKRIKKNWYQIFFFSILALGIFLRFYNFSSRWGLAYDQAHDAVVARYALTHSKLPLLGPFSSAGPFQTGGEWYWYIMLGTAFPPFSVLSPWIFNASIYVLFIALIMLFASYFIDKKFGLIVGSLTAVSTAQISQATNLTNQAPHAILALCAIWSMVTYIRTKKPFYLFFLTLSVTTGISIHLQSVSLVIFIAVTLLFAGVPSKKGMLFLLLGVCIPLLPILVFDVQHGFINTNNMIQYYLHDQYKVSFDILGRRWITYLGVFWPNAWGQIIGGRSAIRYLLTCGVFIILFYKLYTKKISREWLILFVSLILMIILLRYVRTPLFDSYVVFLHPFVLLFTGFLLYTVYNHVKLVGLLFFLIVIIGSLIKDMQEFKNINYTSLQIKSVKHLLYQKYPGLKFAIYDKNYKTVDKSVSLALFLETENRVDNNGKKIGFMIATSSAYLLHPVIFGNGDGYVILDLSTSNSAQLAVDNWAFVNPSQIYESTEEWKK